MQLRPSRILTALALTALASPALAELRLVSQVPGLDLVRLATLPAAPEMEGEAEFCTHLFVEAATTAGGRDATAKGWHVTAEALLGDLTAVSFVGSASPATSGSCELQDGNVALYSGSQLVALVYGTKPDELRVASLRPFGTGLRILSGDLIAATTADLSYDGSTLTIAAPAAEEPVCNGAATVPAIEGQPIDRARQTLIAAGWQPVPGDPAQQALGWARDLAAAGVPEVEDCSGTGFGFCAFSYAGPAATLSVVTAGVGGEDGSLPAVVRYGVDCK